MKLTLTVEKTPDPSLQGTSMSFGTSGGTIGRAGDNDWVLPDPNRYTSSRHAAFKLDGDQFVIVDMSTNGTFHNTPERLIGKNRTAPLASGDRLFIGEFVLAVEVETEASSVTEEDEDDDDLLPPSDGEPEAPHTDTTPSVSERDEFDSLLDPRDPPDTSSSLDSDDDELPFAASGRGLGPLDLDDDESEAEAESSESSAAGLSQSPEREYFSAPGLSSEKASDDIPDEWDALLTGFFEPPSKPSRSNDDGAQPSSASPSPAEEEAVSGNKPSPAEDDESRQRPVTAPEPEPAPRPEPPRRPSPPRPQQKSASTPAAARTSAGDAEFVAALMQELGIGDLSHAVDADDFAQQVGKVVRLVGEGLMQLLASRADIKNEFRIDQTRISSSRNNPLKFSPSIEEAMRRVFVERDAPGFISGAEAFELALNDLRAHQVAILAAVQGAIESVIRQFNPEELERKLKKLSPLSASAPLIREAKCWNLFTAHYEEMASSLRHDAKRMFVQEFAEAYERSSQEIARQIAESRGQKGS